MMEALLKLAGIDPVFLLKVLPIIVLVMGVLSGISIALKAIAKVTASDADDKAAAMIEKIISAAQKVIDFISGNQPH